MVDCSALLRFFVWLARLADGCVRLLFDGGPSGGLTF